MKTIINMFKYMCGYRPNDEIHRLKNEIAKESLKTTIKAKKLNDMITLNKDSAYFLGKAMGTIK